VTILLVVCGEGANERADPMRRASRREARWCVIMVMVFVWKRKKGEGREQAPEAPSYCSPHIHPKSGPPISPEKG